MSYVGRLAPSPTGAQHVGNARTFLIAWMVCRLAKGKLLLRIEDLDTPRTKAWATQQALDDLKWLGLDWDEDETKLGYSTQSDRKIRYDQCLEELKRTERIYPCTCTRSEIDRVASAPHESALDGAIYPGTCAFRTSSDARELERSQLPYAWRFRMPEGVRTFQDDKRGAQTLDAKRYLGDFIVARSYGVTAYQLAVVIDDHDYGINHVVRGNDLIFSTYRQMAIYEAFGWNAPGWMHLPLVVGADGRRLAKRHGDTRLSTYREQGAAPETILGYLAHSIGLTLDRSPLTASQAIELAAQTKHWVDRIPESNHVFSGKFD